MELRFRLNILKNKILLKLFKKEIFYINSPQMLPAPLEKEEEAFVAYLTKEEQEQVKALKPSDESEEYNAFMDQFSDLLNALVAKDLLSALECGESIAALESREKQKAFCISLHSDALPRL